MITKTELEIEEKRDEAAQAAVTNPPASVQYAEGVRDALAWILGDEPQELDL